MLAAYRIGAVPHFGQWRVATQVVDVPVRAVGYPGMMGNPRPQSAGSQRTADIDAITWQQVQFTPLADREVQRFRDGQPQGISAGPGVGDQWFHRRQDRSA